jgi:hypothetical protein
MHKVAALHGVGTGTVQRIAKEMTRMECSTTA